MTKAKVKRWFEYSVKEYIATVVQRHATAQGRELDEQLKLSRKHFSDLRAKAQRKRDKIRHRLVKKEKLGALAPDDPLCKALKNAETRYVQVSAFYDQLKQVA